MKLQDIKSWLESCSDYNAGVKLLEHFSDNKFLIRILSKGPTPFNRDKLEEELQVILASTRSASGKGSAKKEKEKFSLPTARDYDILPEEIQQLVDAKNPLYKEMSHLHSQLTLLKTAEERSGPALRILDIDEQLRSIWAKLDYYEVNKKLPDEPKVPSLENMSMKELVTRRNTLRTYLSRTAEGAGKDDDIATWKMELGKIEKLIAENI
jgi:hypothetical protein